MICYMKHFPMNRIFFNEVRRTPVRRYTAILLSTLLVFATARAAEERHWTDPTTHAHKGIIPCAASSGSSLDDSSVLGGRGYIGQFKLSYALWSLVQEPVHDYIFSWDWQPGNHTVGKGPKGNAITTGDLAKYPDLVQQFDAVKPISVTLMADIEFYDAQNRRYGLGRMKVYPDLIGAAGVKETLHVPGSPKWEDYFQYEYNDAVLHNNIGTADRATRNKKLFQEATSVKLVQPKITAVEWPEGELNLIAGEFTRRETAEQQQLAEAKKRAEAKAKQLASAQTNAAPKQATGPNPFEQATKKSDSPNPFEQAANGTASSGPANPFEQAKAGVSTGPENPFEKTARLERERQAELARQAEIARREQAQRDEIARQEREEQDRKAELARQEEQRRQEYRDRLAAEERNYEAGAADRAYRRAYNQANREKSADMARNRNSGLFLTLQPSAVSSYRPPAPVYVDPNTVVGYRPGEGPRRSGGGSGVSGGGGVIGTDGGYGSSGSSAGSSSSSGSRSTTPVTATFEHRTCPGCNGTGKQTISAGTHNEIYGKAGTTITCDMCGGKGWVYK